MMEMERRRTHVERCAASEKPGLLHCNNGQLEHHSCEPVATELLGDTAHDHLVEDRANQECDQHGNRLREIGARWEVDMAE